MSEAFSGICVLSTEELDAVSGGNPIYQSNSNYVMQWASATNYGNVSATASGGSYSYNTALAIGAAAVNVSTNHQSNSVET